MRKLIRQLAFSTFLLQTTAALAIPVKSYDDFIHNLQTTPGRGFAIGDDIEVNGTLSSLPIFIIAAAAILLLYSNADPQYALLFSDLEVNGSSVFNQLVFEALKPENKITSEYLPNVQGGSTFTATSAFSGRVLDTHGNAISELELGFGVFENNLGQDFFAPIVFAGTLDPLLRAGGLELNLSPVVPESTKGSFHGTARELIARPIPEPGTLWLCMTGILFLILLSRKSIRRHALQLDRNDDAHGIQLGIF